MKTQTRRPGSEHCPVALHRVQNPRIFRTGSIPDDFAEILSDIPGISKFSRNQKERRTKSGHNILKGPGAYVPGFIFKLTITAFLRDLSI